jgi:hypothetical protein
VGEYQRSGVMSSLRGRKTASAAAADGGKFEQHEEHVFSLNEDF